jgi:hypothetical protein
MAYEITVVADSLLQLVKRYFSAASVQEPPELFHARGGRKLRAVPLGALRSNVRSGPNVAVLTQGAEHEVGDVAARD